MLLALEQWCNLNDNWLTSLPMSWKHYACSGVGGEAVTLNAFPEEVQVAGRLRGIAASVGWNPVLLCREGKCHECPLSGSYVAGGWHLAPSICMMRKEKGILLGEVHGQDNYRVSDHLFLWCSPGCQPWACNKTHNFSLGEMQQLLWSEMAPAPPGNVGVSGEDVCAPGASRELIQHELPWVVP